MKANEIIVGHVYMAKVNGKVQRVRVTQARQSSPDRAGRSRPMFMGINVSTGRAVGPYAPSRFRGPAQEIA